MPVKEWSNSKGKKRYQPLYNDGTVMYFLDNIGGSRPALYRSKHVAELVSKLENWKEQRTIDRSFKPND